MLLALLLAAPIFGQCRAEDLSAAGCGPAKTKFDVKTSKNQGARAATDSGEALVYVIEEEHPAPGYTQIGHVTTRVGIDGNWAGADRGNSYISFAVAPGDHRVCSDVQSMFAGKNMNGAADLNAEAGKTYYFRVEVWVGDNQSYPSRFSVSEVDGAEGTLLIARSESSTWKAKD
jgi:hypothetical protein